MLVLPAEAADAILSRGLQNRDLDGLAVNLAVGRTRLLVGDGQQRVVVDRFDKAVAQRIERCPQCPDILRIRHMFLRLGDDRAIIDERTSADAAGTIVDRDRGVDKIAVRIFVADAELGELAGSAADRVLMAVDAGPRIKDGSKPAIDVVCRFVNLLVAGETVAGRFGDPVADALRAGILDKGRRIEARGSFGRGLLRYRHDCHHACTKQCQNSQPKFSSGDHGSISPTHRPNRIAIG